MLFWLSLILIVVGVVIYYIPDISGKITHEKIREFFCWKARDFFANTGGQS